MQTTDPHHREAAGAIAGMTETYGYSPKPGDRVRAELPFKDTYGIGTVVSVNAAVAVVEDVVLVVHARVGADTHGASLLVV